MRRLIQMLLVVVCLAGVACETPPPPDPTLIGDRVEMRTFDYPTVKHKSRTLREGMSKLDVLYMLGKPTTETRDRWTYRPQDAAAGDERLIVRFVGGTYIKHEFVRPPSQR